MPTWTLHNLTSGGIVGQRVRVADGFWSRLVGWQFRARPDGGEGLLLAPCASIHTCFLRFALDLVCVDGGGFVAAVMRNIRPWRVVWAPRGTHAILELPGGMAQAQRGDALRLGECSVAGTATPASVRFLDSNHDLGQVAGSPI